MTASSTRPDRKKYSRILALPVFIFWLGVWQLVSFLAGKEYLLPSPADTFSRLFILMGETTFRLSVLSTCLRVLEGFLGGLTAGILLAFLTSRRAFVMALVSPFLRVIRATPVASFILLALVWLPSGRLPAFVAFLMVLPLTFTNLTEGMSALDRELLEMAGLFRFSGVRTLRLILLPGLMPYLTSACAAGLGFAWKSVIAAEVICHPALSVGGEIQNARVYLEMADLFALTAAVIFISVIIERGTIFLLKLLEKRLLTLSPEKGGAAS